MSRTASHPSGLRISEVSRLLGIPVPTIRSWERRYGFPAPPRTEGRHRRYNDEEIEQLRSLLEEITRGSPASEAAALIQERLAGSVAMKERFLDPFLKAANAQDPPRMRRVLDQAVEALGVEAAVQSVALPAMRDLGRRWKAGTSGVGVEHLATATVRQLFARLSGGPASSTRSGRNGRDGTVVLACGPGETHTLGIEAFALILSRRGWDCRLLGADTPAETVASAAAAGRAVAAAIVSHRRVNRRAAVESIRAVDALPGVAVFYAGGAFATPPLRKGVPGTFLGSDLVAAAATLESIVTSRRRKPP